MYQDSIMIYTYMIIAQKKLRKWLRNICATKKCAFDIYIYIYIYTYIEDIYIYIYMEDTYIYIYIYIYIFKINISIL